jgi:hypothetical protein
MVLGKQMNTIQRKLVHEIWEDLEEDGQWFPGMCLSGPMGDDFRALQSKRARLINRIEAASHFDAMTQYHELLGFEPYTTEHEADHRPYPEEWFFKQSTTK